MTGVSTRKELLGIGPESRPKYILGSLLDLKKEYVAPKETKRGFKCNATNVELLGNRVRVVDGDPASIDALKAACAVIWNAGTPIYNLDVEESLYS
jgi:hypothetical protein